MANFPVKDLTFSKISQGGVGREARGDPKRAKALQREPKGPPGEPERRSRVPKRCQKGGNGRPKGGQEEQTETNTIYYIN